MSEFPNWQSFTPEFADEELKRLFPAAEAAVAALEQSEASTFEALVWALNDATHDLWHAWGRVSHMLGVRNSQAWRDLEARYQPQLVAFSLRVGQSAPIYRAAKTLAEREADPTRRRILAKMVEAAEHAGVGLEGERRERFNAIQAALAKLSADFHNAVIDATTDDIADAVYVEAMKHETDRTRREALYRKRSTRAPENAARIDEILQLRRESAALLGYGNYADLSLASKAAPSVAAVMEMIDALDAATVASAAAERTALEAMTEAKLEPWDVAFYAERLREKQYAYSEEELKACFPFDRTLAGLFKMADFLFGVEVVEVAAAAKPSVWHPDVRFFEVREGGRRVANFYLDAYARPGEKSGGAWMNEFRNRCDRKGDLPLAVVVLNLKPAVAGEPTLLPLREVETLFHEFGHALQCMLTRVGEEDAAGINLIEWDAVEVASQFMENWCLDDRTGIAVPEGLKAKVRAAKNFRAASACRRQLAFAKADLELHKQVDGSPSAPAPAEIKRRNFEHFGLMLLPEDRFLCAFTHIFAGGYAAGYYGYKWAEVMSADCYGAFEEATLGDDAAMRTLGARYRETILALGGSQSAMEVFRQFRGRAPTIDALLRQQGLAKRL